MEVRLKQLEEIVLRFQIMEVIRHVDIGIAIRKRYERPNQFVYRFYPPAIDKVAPQYDIERCFMRK